MKLVSIPIGFSSSLQRKPGAMYAIRITSFNPYRVFKFAATQRTKLLGHYDGQVSIPIGFSSSLQPLGGMSELAAHNSFNPYRVFKFAATATKGELMALAIREFQSLSGFQVRCNFSIDTLRMSPLSMFQSLSGFQVRCNPGSMTLPEYVIQVSIPIGFSSSLQLSRAASATPFA